MVPLLWTASESPRELRKRRFLDFRPVRGNCAARRLGLHPHPTAWKQVAPGPLLEKHSRTAEVRSERCAGRGVGVGGLWGEPQQ